MNPESYQLIARWALFRQGLTKIFDYLQNAQIDFLILKGWAFMGDIYTDLSQRLISDVDILLKPQDLKRVASFLQESGYTCFVGSQFLDNQSAGAANHAPLELSFSNQQGTNIDLHTHIMPSDWTHPVYKIDMDAIWHAQQPFTDWTGRELKRLNVEHTFLHLMTHIMRHDLGTQSPQSYRDLDRWVRKYYSEMNWDEVIRLADQWGLNTALCFITSYSYVLLRTPFPQEFLDATKFSLHRQKWIRKLIPLSAVQKSKKLPGWRVIPAKLLLIDHPKEIRTHLLNSLFPSHQYRHTIHGARVSLLYHWLTIFQKIIS